LELGTRCYPCAGNEIVPWNTSCMTSPARSDSPILPDVRHLGPRAALYLLSLLRSQASGERLTPTTEATARVLQTLHALGVITIDPADHGNCPTMQVERHRWVYTWGYVPADELEAELIGYLTKDCRRPPYDVVWLGIWRELVNEEIGAYLHHQLRLNHFSTAFLQELPPHTSSGVLENSLGQWRYALSATVQSMAATADQHPGHGELIRYVLNKELPQRLVSIRGSQDERYCFPPPCSPPEPSLVRVFQSVATELRERYWREPPTLQVLGSYSGVEHSVSRAV
jgi:hypothetical protein